MAAVLLPLVATEQLEREALTAAMGWRVPSPGRLLPARVAVAVVLFILARWLVMVVLAAGGAGQYPPEHQAARERQPRKLAQPTPGVALVAWGTILARAGPVAPVL